MSRIMNDVVSYIKTHTCFWFPKFMACQKSKKSRSGLEKNPPIIQTRRNPQDTSLKNKPLWVCDGLASHVFESLDCCPDLSIINVIQGRRPNYQCNLHAILYGIPSIFLQ